MGCFKVKRQMQAKTKNTSKYPGTLISLEGISGVGKSFFGKFVARKLQELGHKVTLISDLYDYDSNDIGKQILDILLSTNDKFFRIGYPVVEGLLLSALKFYEIEKWILPALKKGQVVLEDRSIDSVAIYSAVLINQQFPEKDILKTYDQLYKIRKQWGILPDFTIYIKNDFNTALQRAETRNQDKYKKDEIALLAKISEIYDIIAQKHKDRISILNTMHLSPEKITKKLIHLCLQQIKYKNNESKGK